MHVPALPRRPRAAPPRPAPRPVSLARSPDPWPQIKPAGVLGAKDPPARRAGCCPALGAFSSRTAQPSTPQPPYARMEPLLPGVAHLLCAVAAHGDDDEPARVVQSSPRLQEGPRSRNRRLILCIFKDFQIIAVASSKRDITVAATILISPPKFMCYTFFFFLMENQRLSTFLTLRAALKTVPESRCSIMYTK